MTHKCPPIIALAALHLATKYELSAHLATYTGIACPMCKTLHRTTRLATTIHSLRSDGWVIDTERTEGLQANYLLKRAGGMPKALKKVEESNLQRWSCLGYKRTSRGTPGTQVKGYLTHDITYPEQPNPSLRSTTDLDGRWAYGRCATCDEVTLWQKRKPSDTP